MSGLLGEALLSCMGSAFTIVGEIMGANHFLGLLYEGAHDLNPEKQTRIQSGDQRIILAEQKKEIERWEASKLNARAQS